jgi:methylated-DNA-protein-cysteine methyltransferase-like protein
MNWIQSSPKKNNNPENEGFFERVYKVVRLIPRGRVTSYGAIARYLGTGRSARMVGWAMNNSHIVYSNSGLIEATSSFIPAHRVVNRNGMLTGKHHFGTPNLMRELLENEGLIIKDDIILNFRERFWDPADEIS